MTVFPQQFTLNCVKIGTEHFSYSLYLYMHNGTLLEITSVVNCSNMMTNCTVGSRASLEDINNYAYLHSISLTWDTVAVSSNSFNKSSNGSDLVYQCKIIIGEISSLQTVRVKGNN